MAEPNFPFMTQMANRFREAAGIQSTRIFDSCSDRDCLDDLQVFFSSEDCKVVNYSVSVKAKSAEVIEVVSKVEPQDFHTGYYTVDTTYHFLIDFYAYQSTGAPTSITGRAYHQKRCILFGGKSGVKTFTSAGTVKHPTALPVSVVQVSEPVVLNTILTERDKTYRESRDNIPEQISTLFDDAGVVLPGDGQKSVLITLGLFSIVSLVREVALLMPVYDYAIPEKDCSSGNTDPSEIFNKLRFPAERFYPSDVNIRR